MKIESKYGVAIFLAGSLLLVAVVFGGFMIFGPIVEARHDAWLKRQGDAIVAKIEAFRTARSRLPEDLKEIGVPEGSEFYYVEREGGNYELGWGKGLGSSILFDSRDRKWKAVD
ncbi:hypothetical protein BH09VER1_BH09VER1_49360 [soil metagenome]